MKQTGRMRRWFGALALMILAPAAFAALAMALSYHLPWGVRFRSALWISPDQLSLAAFACGPVAATAGIGLLPIRNLWRALAAVLWIPGVIVLMVLGSWAVTCPILRWCEPMPLTAEGLPPNPLDPPPS